MEENRADFWEMLEQINPIDNFDPKTTKKEVLEFYGKIMKVFAKYSGSELGFGNDDYKRLSKVLVDKGCVKLENFKELLAKRPDYFSSGKSSMCDLIREPKDIGFPASATGNAISNPSLIIGFCFGKGNSCDKWHKNYKYSLEEIETV